MISNTGLPTRLIAKAQPMVSWAEILDGRGSESSRCGLSNISSNLSSAVTHPPGLPGLTTWGMGVLALMLCVAAFMIRRRRAAAL